MDPSLNNMPADAPSNGTDVPPVPTNTAGQDLLGCYQQALGHELPNRLVAIQGLARLLEQDEGGRLSAEGRACLGRLAELGGQAHTFVSALAEIGRALRQAEAPAAVPLDELWREAVAEVRWLYPGGAIRYDSPHPLPVVWGPPDALRRALVEVMLFAVRRVPRGSSLQVEVGANLVGQDSDPDGLAGQDRNPDPQLAGAAAVWVEDDGPVLSPREAQLADDPFAVPADSGRPCSGLFFARLLAERWGGSLRVGPGTGAGCRITLLLPVAGNRGS